MVEDGEAILIKETGYTNSQKYKAKKQNPLGLEDKLSRCVVCGSTMHWTKNLLHAFDKGNEENVLKANIVIRSHNNSFGDDTLLEQTFGDLGCYSLEYGLTLYNCVLDTLQRKLYKRNMILYKRNMST